jgi:hypothetical protein
MPVDLCPRAAIAINMKRHKVRTRSDTCRSTDARRPKLNAVSMICLISFQEPAPIGRAAVQPGRHEQSTPVIERVAISGMFITKPLFLQQKNRRKKMIRQKNLLVSSGSGSLPSAWYRDSSLIRKAGKPFDFLTGTLVLLFIPRLGPLGKLLLGLEVIAQQSAVCPQRAGDRLHRLDAGTNRLMTPGITPAQAGELYSRNC